MSKQHIYYLDYLRVIAIVGVLCLHTAAPYVSMYNKVDFWVWESGIVLNAVVRWCVPIFIMISGTLLLGRKEEPLKVFFKKRANKILIPFIAWSIIYYIWRTYMLDTGFSPKEFIILFLNNNIYYHLWYFYALFCIYLFVPVFSIFVNHASRSLVGYTVALWILFYGGFRYYSFIISNNFTVFFPLTEYIGMLLMGYYFGKYEQSLKMRIGIYICGVLGALATVLRTNSLTFDQGVFSSYAYSYSSPNVIAMSIGLFVFVKYGIGRLQKNPEFATNKMVKLIAATSFGVYLIHPIILDKLRPFFHEGTTILVHPIIGIPLQMIILLIISVAIAWVIGKIPYIRRII